MTKDSITKSIMPLEKQENYKPEHHGIEKEVMSLLSKELEALGR